MAAGAARRSVVVTMVCVGGSMSACGGDASGCDDFRPESARLAEGESTDVELDIVEGRWARPDIAGSYWEANADVPDGAPRDGTVVGRATLVDVNTTLDGEIRSGVVVVEFDDLEPVRFTGPIGCA